MKYFFKKLSLTKQNYDIHDRKLLIIVAILKYLNIYAKKTKKFNIYINHKNLFKFTTIKKLNERQIRWLKLLNRYKFKIHYILSKKNERINALNRKYDYIKLKKNSKETISTNHVEIKVVIIIINDEKKFSIKKTNYKYSKKKLTIILNNIIMFRC